MRLLSYCLNKTVFRVSHKKLLVKDLFKLQYCGSTLYHMCSQHGTPFVSAIDTLQVKTPDIAESLKTAIDALVPPGEGGSAV